MTPLVSYAMIIMFVSVIQSSALQASSYQNICIDIYTNHSAIPDHFVCVIATMALCIIIEAIRLGKLNSQFIVTTFSVLHAGGRSLFRFHIRYSVNKPQITGNKKPQITGNNKPQITRNHKTIKHCKSLTRHRSSRDGRSRYKIDSDRSTEV